MTEAAAARCWFIAPLNLLAAGVARLPQTLLLALGTLLTWLSWPLTGKRRHYARVNIALCFPELDAAAQRRLLYQNLRATVIGILELVRAWYAPSPRLRGAFDITGLEHLHEAHARGRGVLLLAAHFTHVDLGGRLLSEAFGAPFSVMVRRNNHACIERLQDEARLRVFAHTIDKKDMRGLLRTLGAGGVVGYVADQDFNYQHAFVPFFGIPAATLTAVSLLARRSGAAVLPYWFHRDPAGRYRLHVEAQWEGWPSDDPAADAARYMAELEKVVRRNPEQYLWVHRRFKTRPPGEPGFYS
jgi:Kdo2-lipid IVA lauroyltransferase/acyltransferase